MTTTTPAPQASRLYPGVFFIALGTLLFEISLTRVLSFTIWYHFAYVIISTALLGFGAAGTLLAIATRIGVRDLEATLSRVCLVSAFTSVGVLGFVAAFPLHPMRLGSDAGQLALLVAYQIAAAVPFFAAGIAISLSLREGAQKVDRLYFWDLVGGGIGCALAVPLMNLLSPPGACFVAAAAMAVAAAAFTNVSSARLVALGLAVLALAGSPFARSIPFTPAESKHLADALGPKQMQLAFTHWSALFRTDVVEDVGRTETPVLNTWGISRTVKDGVQVPWGYVVHDGTAGTPLYDLSEGRLDYLDRHILTLPYQVATKQPKVLIIGVGGGRDVITALRYGARDVTGVELDPVTVGLLQERFDELGQGLFNRPEVHLHAGEGRHFVKRSEGGYDLIQITGVDTLAATTSGAYVLAENYLYSVEAIHDYLDSLAPGGTLSIAVGLWNPNEPRIGARMLNVVREALHERGIAHIDDHIAMVHSRTLFADVMVKNEPFTPEQQRVLREKTAELKFMPLVIGGEGHPIYETLLGADTPERDALMTGGPYVIDPVTDDSPFFFHFHRWNDLTSTADLGPMYGGALGQIVLAILLVTLTALGGLFVLAPLVVFRRRGVASGGKPVAGILIYFTSLGLGFMLFEISLMQRFVLYLGYPTYSLSVVLFTLVTALGFGSFFSARWVGREHRALPAAVGIAALLAVFYMYGLPIVQGWTLGAPLALRVGLTIAMLAPLGLTLGIFLPLGIRRAEALDRDLVPWAWGVNGCASVTATVLTVVLAMNYGFEKVWWLSIGVYAIGVAALLLLAPREPAASDA